MKTNLKSMRWHIGVFGPTNAGKSSFINWLVQQPVSITDSTPGTTTDPVEKTMELLPLGPVVWYDTAGYNDDTLLGGERVKKTREILRRIDVAVLVIDGQTWGDQEKEWVQQLQEMKIPFLIVINHMDHIPQKESIIKELRENSYSFIPISSIISDDNDRNRIKTELAKLLPDKKWIDKPLLQGIVKEGDLVALVIPIDLSAPKGRIILPQQQVIREIIDQKGLSMVIVPEQIPLLSHYCQKKPNLLITDSQAFEEVFRLTPPDIPVTSFSILFAHQRGNFDHLLEGAYQLRKLKKGDKVLILEACSHHPTSDDIGRVKLPSWLREYAGEEIGCEVYSGHAIPSELDSYQLVIQCGSCMLNQREVQNRVNEIRKAGVCVTNYGLAIAEMKGHLDRAIKPLGYRFAKDAHCFAGRAL